MTGWLPNIWCCNCIQLTWYRHVNKLTLICLYLTLDPWHLIFDTWQLICYHLILGTCYHSVPIHLTWCCDTWLNTITPDTCIILHIHDFHFYGDLTKLLYSYRDLVFLNSCTPETLALLKLLYSWTPVYLNPWNRETPDIILLILYSCWSL